AGRLVVHRLEDRGIVFSETAGDLGCGGTSGGGQQQESHTPMNRKDRIVILKTDDGVDVAAGEEPSPQARASVAGREARWQQEAGNRVPLPSKKTSGNSSSQ